MVLGSSPPDPEFDALTFFKQWLAEKGPKPRYIDPGRPWQNAYGESFNGRLRDECLNLHWFATIVEARRIIEAWRRDYNPASQHPSVYVIDGKRVC